MRTLTALLVVTTLGALAAAPVAAEPLDFATLMERAAAGSSQASVADLGVDVARADRTRTLWRVLPRVDVTASLTRNDRAIAIRLPVATPGYEAPVFQQERILRLGAEVRAVLVDAAFFPLYRSATHAIAGAQDESVAAERAAQRAAVELFAAWQSLCARREVALRSTAVLAAHREQVEALVSAGVATELDLEQAQLAELDTQLALLELEASIAEVERGAAALIGTSEPVELTGELPPVSGSSVWAERDAAEARLAAADARLRSLRLEYVPRLVATGQASLSDAEAVDGEHGAWQLTLAVQWTAYAGQSRQAAREAGRAQQQLALIGRDEALRAVARTQTDDAADIALAEQTASVAAQRAATAASAADIARRALAAGAIAPPDALDAELRDIGARSDSVAASVALRRAQWVAALR